MPRGIPNAPRKEMHSSDVPLPQVPELSEHDRGESIVLEDPKALAEVIAKKEYAEELAFMEDPLTIRIEPAAEENAPIVVDCWVNGKGAEVMDTITGKFMELGCLPIGQPIITKRKYVEVLARSYTERVETSQGQDDGSRADIFKMRRNTSRKALFSVLNDPAGARGHAWLTTVLSQR
jgi:hypothetical protein